MYPSEAKIVYAEKHEDLWVTFVEEAVNRAGYPELKTRLASRKQNSRKRSGISTKRLY